MTTLLVAAWLVDGDSEVDSGYVAMHNGVITEVGRGTPKHVSRGSIVHDLGDATILAGLVDAHVHVAGLHGAQWTSGESVQAVARETLAVASGLGSVLRSGVTALRDCGYPHHGIFAVRDAQRVRGLLGPRIVAAGRAIRSTGGHGASISVVADGADRVRSAARAELAAGADFIKLMMTGGTSGAHERVEDIQLTTDEVTAAVAEAHARGHRVAAHCSNLKGTRLAVEAGVDSVEHGIELDDDLVAEMARRGTWLVPGLMCTRIEASSGPDSSIPDHVRDKACQIQELQAASFQRALRAGVQIAAATDAGPTYLPIGGQSLVAEMKAMVELGMSRLQAIRAATMAAAELLGIGDIVGSLGPGKQADLIVARGNVAENLDGLAELLAVVQDGVIVAGSFAP